MSTSPTENAHSPWHPGELELQKAAGVAQRMDEIGRRVIRGFMLDQHRAYYMQLPFVVLGAVDRDGDPWATLLAGKPGFLQAPTEHRLSVTGKRDPRDPASSGFDDGASVGLLGIELDTRRRNRLNGIVRNSSEAGFDIEVAQSFGNCPQYIQLRDFEFVRDSTSASKQEAVRLSEFSERTRAMITGADTLFVASYVDIDGEPRQVDVSHRGGRAGFVRLGDDGVLTIPDFAGNSFFATLGNFLVNPKAGLVFTDFETGDLLQLSGDAEVVLQSPEIAAFQGAERLWRFKPRRIVYRPEALPLHWTFQHEGWSPNSLMTGDWAQVEERLQAAALADSWRPFRVTKIVDESSLIRSFYLDPQDGAGRLAHQAGQHLPIRVTLAYDGKPVIRTYTLSVSPSDGFYRISVKREGAVSAYLHDNLRVGDVIEARAPAGQFIIDALERRPAVLLAAGVGVTPMLAMLRHIVYEGLRTRRVRPTWFFHAAHSLAERAFATEIHELAQKAQGRVRVMRLLTDPSGALEEKDYDVVGRIDLKLLKHVLSFDDYDFYLCGPGAFMQSIYDGLRNLNIADARIHAESFGSAALLRKCDHSIDAAPEHVPAEEPISIAFVKSGKQAQWTPESGSLLKLAESRGLSPEFGCRGGTCGTCRTRIVKGVVAYAVPPSFKVPDDEALICCAVPAKPEVAGDDSLQLDL
jgi:ferredoxin-NADP reductase/predicted pyridoxine 5'-phosphate oxidase superfamily flavin-nucleotide-binding protein